MNARGRKATRLATVTALPLRMLEPPADLTPAQADVWAAIVATKPSDWFGADTVPLLAAYCRAVIEHRWISAQIDAKKDEWLLDERGFELYDRATKLQERQARMMSSLATKMRLTQQSQYGARGAARNNRPAGAKPWGQVVDG